MLNRVLLVVAGAAAFVFVEMPAQAALTLTSAATAAGFTLSTFATGFPSNNSIGPLGIAFTDNGGVMVTDIPGNVRVFPTDTDNQTAGSVAVAQNFGLGNAIDLAKIGPTIYMAQQTSGRIVSLNQNGTLNATVATGVTLATSLISNPTNGHLLVSEITQNAIYDVDPATGTKSLFLNVTDPDGITLTPDGSVLYVATNGAQILGFNTTTKAQVFSSGPLNTVDGTALGVGPLTGTIFGNTNDGRVVQVNLSTGVQTVIATGGSRGDFVKIDPNDGSLLLTQTDSIYRLKGIGGFVPHPILSLNPATPTALYGTAVTNGTGVGAGTFSNGTSTLTVTGSGKSYKGSQVTGINGGAGLSKGFIPVSGFTPATDPEGYALEVLIGGVPATPAQIATLVADMNSVGTNYGLAAAVASALDPSGGAFAKLSPSTPYNLYLTFNGPASGSNYFAFDLTQDPTFGASATVVAVAVVPEPSALCMAAIPFAAIGLGRRRADAGR